MERKLDKGSAKWYEVEHLLGMVPDSLISYMIGKPKSYVAQRRIERYILPFRDDNDLTALSLTIEKRLEYYIERLSMIKDKFAKLRDIDIFKVHRFPIATIAEARRRWGIPEPVTPSRWEEAKRYAGKMPDKVAAEIAGVAPEMIKKFRTIHGIPEFNKIQPNSMRGKVAVLLALEAASASFAQQIEGHAIESLKRVWDGRRSCCAWHIARPQKALPMATTASARKAPGQRQEGSRPAPGIAQEAYGQSHRDIDFSPPDARYRDACIQCIVTQAGQHVASNYTVYDRWLTYGRT